MATSSDRPISMIDAARLIFRTRTPSDKQVHRIYQLMKAGALTVRNFAGPPLKWTTTEAAVADFLAAGQVHRTLGHPAVEAAKKRAALQATESPTQLPANYEEESVKLRGVYQSIWRDYFLAVMLRRRTAHRSRTFQRAVVAGQVILLLTMIVTFIGGFRYTFLPAPPEHLAIEHWIELNTDEFHVSKWHPTVPASDGDGSVVRVEYRYQKESQRWIYTDRTFRVCGDEVTEIEGL